MKITQCVTYIKTVRRKLQQLNSFSILRNLKQKILKPMVLIYSQVQVQMNKTRIEDINT